MAEPRQLVLLGDFGYTVVVFDPTKPLGSGAYGGVFKARCDELPCAAKLLHPNFFISNDPGIQNTMRRFEQECEVLSTTKHPCIVQYLGTAKDPETERLVLLMELMDESLTKFLKQSTAPLPYHIELNLCYDIALALAYLHSKSIIHRDLSSNNVLLIAGSRAKVTDFGNLKLADVNSHIQTHSLTHCPGTVVYMPPEALLPQPKYTNKLDCFSSGVLVVQILTRHFPDPAPSPRTVEDPRSPTGKILIPVPEVERRMSDINCINPAHPLLPIALNCLKDNDKDRPSAQDICLQLSLLKESEQYATSVQQARDKDALLCTKTQEIKMREKEVIELSQQLEEKIRSLTEKDRLLADKDQRIGALLCTKTQEIETREKEVIELSQQLEEKIRSLTEKDRLLADKDQRIGALLCTKTQEIETRENDVIELSQQLEEKIRSLTEKDRLLADKDQRIGELQQQLKESVPNSAGPPVLTQLSSAQSLGALRPQLSQNHAPNLPTHRQPSRPAPPPPRMLPRQWGNQQPPQTHQQPLHNGSNVQPRQQPVLPPNPLIGPPPASSLFSQLALKSKPKPAKRDANAPPAQAIPPTNQSLTLKWKVCSESPSHTLFKAESAAVVDGDTAYVVPIYPHSKIHAYNGKEDRWSQLLPDCPHSYFALAVVNGLLSAVGGEVNGNESNAVISLRGREWVTVFPPMPIKGRDPAAICTGKHLVVAGGDKVAIMDTTSLQWYSASSLPDYTYGPSILMCGQDLYLSEGNKILSCSLPSLLQSCQAPSTENTITGVWRRIANNPVCRSAYTAVRGQLVSLGGSYNYQDRNPVPTIHCYDPNTDSWRIIGTMPTARRQCLAVTLRGERLTVMGGYPTASDTSLTTLVEMLTYC